MPYRVTFDARMKRTYIIIGSVLLSAFFFLASCKNKHNTENNVFEELRNIALEVTPAQLGIDLPADSSIVYGVVMDWEMNGSTVTLVSYQTGDASLYLSSGGGVVGGGKHKNVNIAAKKFVELANNYLDKTAKSEAATLPATDEVAFYFLSSKGIYE
ncbi:MAG: hypothetical protein J7497_00835, partial [Chitinophagaceae bacterium]|nr:hypothetical protein [Chitinophagaceae bacterium]